MRCCSGAALVMCVLWHCAAAHARQASTADSGLEGSGSGSSSGMEVEVVHLEADLLHVVDFAAAADHILMYVML